MKRDKEKERAKSDRDISIHIYIIYIKLCFLSTSIVTVVRIYSSNFSFLQFVELELLVDFLPSPS